MEATRVPSEVKALMSRLQQGSLPGWDAQSLACPPGRPKDLPERLNAARRAGVVCLLCPNAHGQWSLVLMERTLDNTPHSGQLAFPGGSEEEVDGGDLVQTARREFAEEMGVTLTDNQMLGELSMLYIPPSNFLVQPVLAWSDVTPEFVLQKEEVARVMVVPLAELPQPGAHWPEQRVTVRSGTARVPGWPVGEGVLWGATAMMVAELLEVCVGAGFGLSFASSNHPR